jgi:hypothetical protein
MRKIEDKNVEIAGLKYSLDTQIQKDKELQGCIDEKEGRICDLENRNCLLVQESDSKAGKVSENWNG